MVDSHVPDRVSFDHMRTFLCASEILGRPVAAKDLVAQTKSFSRVELFAKLAVLAATIGNQGSLSPEAIRLTTDAITAYAGSLNIRQQAVAVRLQQMGERVIAHERVIYWLQCLALVTCASTGLEPSWADVAWLLVQANDHVDRRIQDDAMPGDPLERGLVSFFVASRFDVGMDPVAAHARAYQLTNTRPEHGPLADPAVWDEVMAHAFHGTSFREYFTGMLTPLVLESLNWGIGKDGQVRPPVINPGLWLSEVTHVPEIANSVFDGLSISEEEARRELVATLDADGVPQTSDLFAHRPFLRVDNGSLIAASPWLVLEQMRLGIWDKCRRACNDRLGSESWNRAFGQIFEIWAREISKRAAATPGFVGSLVLSKNVGGSDEVEDVVVHDAQNVMLGSAKSSLIPKPLFSPRLNSRKVVEWYEKVLFGHPSDDRRAGALRLLDQRVRRCRGGDLSGIDRSSTIYPVVITYERLGDSPVFYQWVQERSKDERVLQQSNVAPTTFVSAADFEMVMAASPRVSIFEILRWRCGTDDGLASVQRALIHFLGRGALLRMPGTMQLWDRLTRETRSTLFGSATIP